MPWQESCAMDERVKFVIEVAQAEESMAELCRRYGISRKTGYKWLARSGVEGLGGLADRSCAAHHHPNQTPAELEAEILQLRAERPHWGPRKLLWRLQQLWPDRAWPSRSTVAELLRRSGLSASRRRRPASSPGQPFSGVDGPNATWCIDFKGWFRTGDGSRCEPLTLSDAFSRYLLRCQVVGSTGWAEVRPLLEAAFRAYGLPRAIRSDNGPPFAGRGLGGLSRLSVWWLRLGIRLERTDPGSPQQNGRLERLHRTLKAETASPAAATLRAQQCRFDGFRVDYNEHRPHEALGMATPGSCYEPSQRSYPSRLPEFEYPDDWQLRRVKQNGEIGFCGPLFVSEVLSGETVALSPVDGRHWILYFGPLPLAILDQYCCRLLTRRQIVQRGLSWPAPAVGRVPSAALQDPAQQPMKAPPMRPD